MAEQLLDNSMLRLLERGPLCAANDPSWLAEVRRAARQRFEQTGWPSSEREDWRFTPRRQLEAFSPRVEADDAAGREPGRVEALLSRHGLGQEAAAELVFINGRYQASLSHMRQLPRGVMLLPLREALQSDQGRVREQLGRLAGESAPVSLNSALFEDGAYLFLPRGMEVQGPIHLLFLNDGPEQERDGATIFPRLLLIAADAAAASIVETHAGRGWYLSSAVAELFLGRDSRVEYNKLQEESAQAIHLSALHGRLGQGASLVSHSITLGAKLSRNVLEATLDGERAQTTLNGLVFMDGDSHSENHTLLRHAKPNCPSHELYKHILADRASAVFRGKIYVDPGADGTDAKQNSKSLLLSDQATMDAMPALEIYADDVKCTHGSTIGPLDDEMTFYLRSRGVSLEAARHLLTYAFAADVTRRISVGPLRQRVEDFLASRENLPLDLRITETGAHDDAAR